MPVGLLIAGAFLVAVYLVYGDDVVELAEEAVTRAGGKLTSHQAPKGGFLAIPPEELAALVPVYVDYYSLARGIGSESSGSSPEAERIAIGWVIVNQCRQWGTTITEGVTRGSTGKGFYGAQDAGGRWISTARDPSRADLELAQSILNGHTRDNTGGATKFFHADAQNALHRKDPVKYKTAAAVTAKWQAEGHVIVDIGVSLDRFVVFRKVSAARVA